MIDFEEKNNSFGVSIKVIGVGGAGSNTVNSLFNTGCSNIECIIANTDAQALANADVACKIQIGVKTTKGLGAGANPDLGQRSAQEDLDKILEKIGDANIVFLTGGMGGGTASGALPVIARAIKERGILVIAIVTKPFAFEGKRRARIAQEAIEMLSHDVDTLIVVPNQKLIDIVDQKMSMIDAFSMINSMLSQSVKGISDIIIKPGHINVDFADLRVIMKDMGLAVLGTGRASGSERALEAARAAISSPLLENMSIDGASGVLLNITGGSNLGLHEISAAASLIYERVDENANIILGSVIDTSMTDEVSVTIIATGFRGKQQRGVKLQESMHDARNSSDVYQENNGASRIEGNHAGDHRIDTQFDTQRPEFMTSNRFSDFKGSGGKRLDNKEGSIEVKTFGQGLVKVLQEQNGQEIDLGVAKNYDMSDLDVPAYLRQAKQENV